MEHIPQNHIEFCKEIAQVCKKHGIERMHGVYRPDFDDDISQEIHEIEFNWAQGRHGAESDEVTIRAQTWVRTTVQLKNIPQNP